MSGPAAGWLPGQRLHLQHGPIDLVIAAFGPPDEVAAAYRQAWAAFHPVLEDLVAVLPLLRTPVAELVALPHPDNAEPSDRAARQSAPSDRTGCTVRSMIIGPAAARGTRGYAPLATSPSVAAHADRRPTAPTEAGLPASRPEELEIAPGTRPGRQPGQRPTRSPGPGAFRAHPAGRTLPSLQAGPATETQTGPKLPPGIGPGTVAARMIAATLPHEVFVTPMAAVAGAVADHVLAAMIAGRQLQRAYVNNGGDAALWLTPGAALTTAGGPALADRIRVPHDSPVRGVATSGRHGRSHSRGIADAVTVLARSAAGADAAATLIANAVDLPGHPAVTRRPSRELAPESDLGDRAVTVALGPLTVDEVNRALTAGRDAAERMLAAGLIEGAALWLGARCEAVHHPATAALFPRVPT